MYSHAAICPAAPDPASQPRWALGLPRVQRLWDPPSSQGGLRHRHMYHGSGLAGRAPECCESCSSGSSLPAKEGSRAAMCLAALGPASQSRQAPTSPCIPWLQTHWEGSRAPCVLRHQILPPYGEGSGLPRVLWCSLGCGPQA
jgi:hypothetical protein